MSAAAARKRSMRASLSRSRFGVPLLLIALWQIAAVAGAIDTLLLPSPLAILGAWQRLIASGDLLRDAQASLLRVGAGFALASLAGVLLGLLFARAPVASAGLRASVEFLRPIPPIAWIPLAILWFGIGNVSAIFIVFTGSFFPIFLTTFQAAERVPEDLLQTARCYGARGWRLFLRVLLPAAAPEIATGLRVGLGVAWTSVIAAELVGAQSGLGYMIQLNRMLLQMENVIAGMMTIGLIGFGLYRLTDRIEVLVIPWSRRDDR